MAMYMYIYQCHKAASQNGARQGASNLYTSAGFHVTIEEKTITALASEATLGIHTRMFTAMGTLAFVDVCINTGVADHRHSVMHIHPRTGVGALTTAHPLV